MAAKIPNYWMSVAKLKQLIGKSPKSLKIFDCTHTPNALSGFAASSIPGAYFLDIKSVHQPESVPFAIPSQNHFVEKMKEYRISKGDTVVCYGQKNVFGAYRMWYLLTSFGHPNTFVLDGNLNEWALKGFDHTFDNLPERKPSSTKGDFSYERKDWKMDCGLDDVIEVVKKKQGVIIDAREPDAFKGKPAPPRKFAHIPGAISLYSGSLLGENGKILELSELNNLLKKKTVDLSKKMMVYCNRGVVATTCFTALAHLGADVKLYNGSWGEYGSSEKTLAFE